MAAAKGKKKTRKNSNYRPVDKVVSLDQLLRYTLCVFRKAKKDPDRADALDETIYGTAMEFCLRSGAVTAQELADTFEGRHHEAMTEAEIAGFTGLVEREIGKKNFVFESQGVQAVARLGMVRLALCHLISDLIQTAIDEKRSLTPAELQQGMGYMNFCATCRVVTEDQCLTMNAYLTERQQLDLNFVEEITEMGRDVIMALSGGSL